MVFKALHGLAPEYVSKLFIRNYETHLLALINTSTDLQLLKKRTHKGQKCFSYKGVKSWNCLSLESEAKIGFSFLFFFLNYDINNLCIPVYFIHDML